MEDPKNGGFNVQRLEEEHELKKFVTFQKILDGEFSEDKSKLIQHKAIIDNFYVELRVQINKDVKDILKPATFNIT